MSDMPGFRAWANSAHRDSLRKPRKSKNPRFRCKLCQNRTTKNQAKANGGNCFACHSPLVMK